MYKLQMHPRLKLIYIYYTPHKGKCFQFGARWLASSEVIIQVNSPPSIERRVKLKKSIIFQFIVTDRVVFGAIYSTCVVYTKTIIHLHIDEQLLIESLSTRPFRAANGNRKLAVFLLNLSSFYHIHIVKYLSLVETISLKSWKAALPWHAKCSLPVPVRGSKTSLSLITVISGFDT